MTLVFLIGWQFLYCSFSIYLGYHPDGLGGSVNHCTVHQRHFSNYSQPFSLGPLNFNEASQPRVFDYPRTLRAAEYKCKQVKLFICSRAVFTWLSKGIGFGFGFGFTTPFGWLVYLLWFWFYDSQVKTALLWCQCKYQVFVKRKLVVTLRTIRERVKHSRQLIRCVYETKKVSHRWTHYKAWYL